jgi:hypothetical protein
MNRWYVENGIVRYPAFTGWERKTLAAHKFKPSGERITTDDGECELFDRRDGPVARYVAETIRRGGVG